MVPSDIYIIIFTTLPLKAKEEQRKKKASRKTRKLQSVVFGDIQWNTREAEHYQAVLVVVKEAVFFRLRDVSCLSGVAT